MTDRGTEADPPVRLAHVAAVALWLATLGGGVATIMATFAIPRFITRNDATALGLFIVVLVLVALVYCSTGLLITLRRSGNRIGWILLVAGPLLITTFAGFAIGPIRTLEAGPDDLLAGLLSWMGVVSFYPVLTLLVLLALLFPDGRLPSSRWRLPVRIVLVLIGAVEFTLAVRPGGPDPTLARNPFGIESRVLVDAAPIADLVGALAFFALLVLAVAAVAIRFRRAHGATREQHKWFLAATTVSAAITYSMTVLGPAGWGVDDLLGIGSLSLLPIAIGIAILRFRLYDIDRLISRTLSWAIVSGILLGTFGAGLVALQAVLIGFTQGQMVAVAGSTLLALAVFQPVRRRVQAAIDRRFYRTRYDGARIVEDFAVRLRDQFDLNLIASDVCRVAADAVRPTSVAVWLRSTGRAHP